MFLYFIIIEYGCCYLVHHIVVRYNTNKILATFLDVALGLALSCDMRIIIKPFTINLVSY